MDKYEEAEFRALQHEMDRMEEEAEDEAMIAKYENQVVKEKTMRGYQVRDYLTEEEHEKLAELGDVFWERLGVAAAEVAVQFDESVEYLVIAHLQDKCSIYSTRYPEHIRRLRYD